VNAKSAEVSGVPSDHMMPSAMVQVIEVRSSDTPPFSTVGISSASHGTIVPVLSKRAIDSSTSDADSISFVPPDRNGFSVEGACQ
jgi:gamma-glutamylcysteine synthetase